ncbi:hypothetical protein C8Q69DRAFT_495002 [Paecilomyces variotii]|uniref:Uncharacterized protein n=1 Tax=Byssochlamys spectabilis TaxID=264951 RepID=A0A443I6F8_BYSSP|nr:hypothetical protein C8Q69DRAFT_495002 [Paecilomyces variotii]RWQ99689.1 hypothetical protein C8Q69DRAFT_495002 [Paecilomyces variotii]
MLPVVFFWLWLNLQLFNVPNQPTSFSHRRRSQQTVDAYSIKENHAQRSSLFSVVFDSHRAALCLSSRGRLAWFLPDRPDMDIEDLGDQAGNRLGGPKTLLASHGVTTSHDGPSAAAFCSGGAELLYVRQGHQIGRPAKASYDFFVLQLEA